MTIEELKQRWIDSAKESYISWHEVMDYIQKLSPVLRLMAEYQDKTTHWVEDEELAERVRSAQAKSYDLFMGLLNSFRHFCYNKKVTDEIGEDYFRLKINEEQQKE